MSWPTGVETIGGGKLEGLVMDAGIRSIHEKLDMLEGRLREIRVAQSHQPN